MGLNYVTFPFHVYFFFILTAAIIVIPILSVIHPIICLTIHSSPITIIIVVDVVIVIVFIVKSLKIILKNF